MELNINFASLWNSVYEMGAEQAEFSIKTKEIDTRGGVEVSISEVTSLVSPNPPLLTYKGEQIILFIPDHSFNFELAVENPRGKQARRFHVANCDTVKKLREEKRFERFKVTKNRDGFFEITGKNRDEMAEVELSVCQNCLVELNFHNFNKLNSWADKHRAVLGFKVDEFFEECKSFFISKPRNPYTAKAGYPENWNQISRSYKAKVGYVCESCGVDLKTHPHLLHVHHINGVKHDTKDSNLKALCEVCHSEQPAHGHMKVSPENKTLIESLR